MHRVLLKSFEDLLNGLESFHRTVVTPEKDYFAALPEGQSPKILLITCSDSRIDPGLLANSMPGSLFVIRNAGNIVPPAGATGETATAEYAVKVLDVEHVIVCGHMGCGAMKGLLDREGLTDLPLVDEWLSHAEGALSNLPPDAQDPLAACVEQNVLLQLDHLKSLPFVKERLEDGRLQLHGWVYDIGRGTVTAHDGKTFRPASEVYEMEAKV